MPLQRETVARAALHLVDEVGLDRLTIRRLAALDHTSSCCAPGYSKPVVVLAL